VIAAPPPPVPVGLGLREYHISVYRPAVPVGAVAFTMTNYGEDAHDLQVLGPGGYRSAVSPDVAGLGGRLRFRVTLRRPGTYRLLCVKPGHVKLGMRTTLRVTRR
jgi:plastocyanin